MVLLFFPLPTPAFSRLLRHRGWTDVPVDTVQPLFYL